MKRRIFADAFVSFSKFVQSTKLGLIAERDIAEYYDESEIMNVHDMTGLEFNDAYTNHANASFDNNMPHENLSFYNIVKKKS